METFGRSRKRRTSSVGGVTKHSTLRQPWRPSCRDSSRAYVSVPPMNRGSTSKTDTIDGATGAIGRSERLSARAGRPAVQSRHQANLQIPQPQVGVVNPGEGTVDALSSPRLLESGPVVGLVTEAQDALVLVGEATQEGRVQQQWMVPVRLEVLFLQRNLGIVVVEEYDLPRLQHRYALAVYSGGVEEERGASRPGQLRNLRCGHIRQVGRANAPRGVLPMGAPDVVERPASHVGQVEAELHFLRDVLAHLLVVPLITVPAVKVTLGGKRPPSSGFDQRTPSKVPLQYSLHDRVHGDIHEPLLEGQHILDHMPVRFGLLVSVDIVPAQLAEPGVECLLHD